MSVCQAYDLISADSYGADATSFLRDGLRLRGLQPRPTPWLQVAGSGGARYQPRASAKRGTSVGNRGPRSLITTSASSSAITSKVGFSTVTWGDAPPHTSAAGRPDAATARRSGSRSAPSFSGPASTATGTPQCRAHAANAAVPALL